MLTEEITSTNKASNKENRQTPSGQYALWQIIGIWLAAGAPMWLLADQKLRPILGPPR